MSKLFSFLLIFMLSLSLLFQPGCGKWEGNYYIAEVQNTTAFYADTTQSLFAVLVQVNNEEDKGVGAVITGWRFQYYEGDDLVIEINDINFQRLEYVVTIYQQYPVGDSYNVPGYINVVSGREVDDWKVTGDIFNGSQPDRMTYHIILTDDNGHRHDLTGETTNSHIIL
jgi:hypothetical protein